MKRICILIFLLISAKNILAQEGAPLLSHYSESREVENQNWSISQDVNHVMVFANRKGILTYDGQDWIPFRLPTIPFSLKTNPADGRIFIGGENSYGYLEKDKLGFYKYVSISGESSNIGVITKIIINDSLVWFYGEQSISRHNIRNNILELRLKSEDSYPFTGMLLTSKNAFVNVQDRGLYRVESDTLFPIVTGYITENESILFALPYNEKMVLVCLSNGTVSLFDGIKYYNYPLKDDGYLKDNILSEGLAIGDSMYAFSTLDGGALVVDKKSGEVRYTFNNQNGLPDDELFAMGLDNSGGLWFSHQFGLTRADLNLPVENFTIYPGLKGNLTNALWYNNELFVGTSEGVYYLAEVKNFSEVEILVKNEPEKVISQPDTPSENIKEQQGSRKNILARIFGKRIFKEVVDSVANASEHVDVQKTVVNRYTRKTVSKLKSINYVFRKVDGLNEKCRQMVSTTNGILAATNKGLYVINNHKASILAENRYINFISWQPVLGKYFVGADNGYFYVKLSNGNWITGSPDRGFTDPVYSVISAPDDVLWLGVDNKAIKVVPGEGSGKVRYTPVSIKNDFPQRYLLDMVNDSVFLFTESGIYFYDESSKTFIQTLNGNILTASKTKYYYPSSNFPIVRRGDEWIVINSERGIIKNGLPVFKIFSDIVSIWSDENCIWLIDGNNRLFRIDLNKRTNLKTGIDIYVKSIYDESGKTFNLSDIVFNKGENVINFDIIAPFFIKEKIIQYQYSINKIMSGWSPWSTRTNYNVMISTPGEYTLQVRAKDLWGNIGEPVLVKFIIKAPFTKTPVFYILSGLLLLVVIIQVIRIRERQLQKMNRLLEQKVKERTAEIEAQKEEITSSIEYASRIQMALLPVDEHFKQVFSDYFIIYKPRDIVSGDFYWIGESDKNIFFTVADCTGHGVPGAFMSTLGIATLNEIITNCSELHANTALNLLREKIMTSLHQTGKEGETTDGMDVAFCVLDKKRRHLQYSGAYNPLFLIQGNEMKEYKADRMPIGIHYGEIEPFTNYEIKVQRGDILYIFSDGFTDQFGGSDGTKYKKSNLKKLLSGIYGKPLSEQKVIIENEFERWKGSAEQIDDMTMIGIRI